MKYHFKVRQRNGGAKYALESGPPGMTLSEDGLLEWTAPEDPADRSVKVVVVITDDAGESLRCELTIEIWRTSKPRE
jgi:hypothetical protein